VAVSCSCLGVKHPGFPTAHRCFTLPRSSILCGCINIPCRQVNAVWGRCPTACTMYVKSWSVLGARRQNLSRLRVEKLGCTGSRDACLSRTCGSSYPGSIYPLRSEFASRPSPRVSGRWAGRGFVPPPLSVPLSAQLGPFFACFVAFCFRTTGIPLCLLGRNSLPT
jgi:hypothetical protein